MMSLESILMIRGPQIRTYRGLQYWNITNSVNEILWTVSYIYTSLLSPAAQLSLVASHHPNIWYHKLYHLNIRTCSPSTAQPSLLLSRHPNSRTSPFKYDQPCPLNITNLRQYTLTLMLKTLSQSHGTLQHYCNTTATHYTPTLTSITSSPSQETLQHYCNTTATLLQHTTHSRWRQWRHRHLRRHCNTLPLPAIRCTSCNSLQRTATHCNTLHTHAEVHDVIADQSRSVYDARTSTHTHIVYRDCYHELETIHSRTRNNTLTETIHSQTGDNTLSLLWLLSRTRDYTLTRLQVTATHCNTLQLTLTLKSMTFSPTELIWAMSSRHSSKHSLQQTVSHCKTLQHTATYCNTLQLTLKSMTLSPSESIWAMSSRHSSNGTASPRLCIIQI